MNQLVTIPVQAWAPRKLSQEDCLRIRHTFCKECSDAEADQFIQTIERTGLDPWARQIYVRMGWDSAKGCKVMQVGVTIDGQRLIAVRTGRYQGQTMPEWCGKDGVWKEVWLEEGPPAACRQGVHCLGFVEPLYGIALYSDYAQKKRDGGITQMWRDKAAHMLWKCAEALGLRKAFPQELSGLYTDDEMMQTEREQPQQQLPAPARQQAKPPAQQPRALPAPQPSGPDIPEFLDRRQPAPDVLQNMREGRPADYISPEQQEVLETGGTKHDADGVVIEENEPEHPDSVEEKKARAYIKLWDVAIETATDHVALVERWNAEALKGKGCVNNFLTRDEQKELQNSVIAKRDALKAAGKPAEVAA